MGNVILQWKGMLRWYLHGVYDTILLISNSNSLDHTIQPITFDKEMPTELILAGDELTTKEPGTRITKERTRSSQRFRKPSDWI